MLAVRRGRSPTSLAQSGGHGEKPSAAASGSAARLHAFDALRAVAMLLGLVLHASLPFMQTDIRWPIVDRSRHVAFDVMYYIIHACRLPLFFICSGFFAHLLYRKRGPVQFAMRRVLRVLLPLLAGVVVVIPLVQVTWVYSWLRRQPPESRPDLLTAVAVYFASGRWLEQFGPIHLWFLEYLLLFYAGTMLMLAVGHFARPHFWPPLRRAVRWLLGSWAKPIVLAALTFPLMLRMAIWNADTPLSFAPAWHIVAFYGIFYGFGWLLCSHRDLLDRIAAGWGANLAVGLLLVLPMLVLLQLPAAGGAMQGRSGLVDLAGRAAYALLTWLLTLGLLGLFVRRFNRPSRVMQYLADASYWMYLVHPPLVWFLNVAVSDWDLPAPLKLLGILFVASSLLLLSYQLGVRHTFLGRGLNGHRGPLAPPQPRLAAGANRCRLDDKGGDIAKGRELIGPRWPPAPSTKPAGHARSLELSLDRRVTDWRGRRSK